MQVHDLQAQAAYNCLRSKLRMPQRAGRRPLTRQRKKMWERKKYSSRSMTEAKTTNTTATSGVIMVTSGS